MPHYAIRRLLIDLESPFTRRWNGGDAFRTAFFNALSMSFPVGEQFFIDALREGVRSMPPHGQQRFDQEVKGFIGQEATHRRIHELFNEQLSAQGLVNAWEPRVLERNKKLAGVAPVHPVAITAAVEHFTAILAEHLLAHPQTLAGAEPRLRTLWLWHACEESEHRSTAIDVYRALGGSERLRRRWMWMTTFYFLSDLMRQTVANLARERQLWRRSSWVSGARFLFGRDHGIVRKNFAPWRAYFRDGFHPSESVSPLGAQWLAANADAFRVVGA